jgi:hypothetical protein
VLIEVPCELTKVKFLSGISVTRISKSLESVGVVFFSNASGKFRSTIKTSKVGMGFKAHCHWGSFAVAAKSAGKRARSLAGRGRRTPPYFGRV